MRVLWLVAGVLVAVVIPAGGWIRAGAIETASDAVSLPAVSLPAVFLQAVSCPSWSEVPANHVPDESRDDTKGAWRGWGPAGEDVDTDRCAPIQGVSFRVSTTLGGGAVDSRNPAFVTPGLEDGDTTMLLGPTDERGSITLPMKSMTESQRRSAEGSDGLWISAVNFGGQFASLRCSDDRVFADNLEVLRNLGSRQAAARCVLYTIAAVTQPGPAPIVTLPPVVPVPTPAVVAPTPAPVAPAVPVPVPVPEPPAPVRPPVPVVATTQPTIVKNGVAPPFPNADGVSAPVPGSRRPGTVVVFLEVIAPQPTWVTSTTLPPSTPVAVDIDCGAFGTRRLRATTDPSGAVAFTSAAPIEVLESTRCGVRAVEGFSVPPEWKSRLTVSGHDVNLGDSVSLPAPAGEQTIVAVRMSFTASSAQENTGSNTVTAGRELAPRNEISGENALGNPGPGSAAIPVPVGPQPLPAPTQLILGATFSLGLVLAALAARRTVST